MPPQEPLSEATSETISPDAPVSGPIAEKNADYYFGSDEVTLKPRVISDVAPEFTLKGIENLPPTLVMTLRISETGDIDDVVFEQETLPEDTQQRINDAFRAMKFDAARIGSRAVRSQLRIEVLIDSLQ